MRVNLRLIQLLGDALIPILGFFWWNWNLYFIVLFYLLDLIANEFIVHLKANKIQKHHEQRDNKKWLVNAMIGVCLLIFGLVLTHLALQQIQPDIDFKKELIAFWTYEDLGMEQGYFLLPLIIFASYQRYKMEFLLSKKYITQTTIELFRGHIQSLLMIIGFVGIAYGVSFLVVFPEIVYVLGIILLTSIYQLLGK